MATVHPALAPYVSSLHPYDVEYAVGSGVHIGMPSTELTLVLPLDEPLEVAWTDVAGDEGEPSTAWASVSGLHTSAAAVHHGRRQRGIQLALTPAAARAFWGVPAAALASRVVLEALGRGLLLLKAGVGQNCIRVLVPLVVTDAELDEALGVWEDALAATL